MRHGAGGSLGAQGPPGASREGPLFRFHPVPSTSRFSEASGAQAFTSLRGLQASKSLQAPGTCQGSPEPSEQQAPGLFPEPAQGLQGPPGASGGLRNQNPKSKTQNQKSKTQNPKSKTQNPKPKIQNPKYKIQSPKPKTQIPKS